ncbi:peptidase S9 [Stenotrophomonas sp. ZAC14D1_NAIMI4_6]|uniref:alpha/beta hydrolase family protein n=1 Tax=unclassified Stenotrophomonas maltophilia group TaxID=2961925 RepID=UPI000D53F29D|nr:MULTISPECIES: prolyl oligopeptidase family serine peptidase [unclassified Stenotrophomonas maltophilia group]AWH36276.1 peptidase S9 [Stenotrophomonas sp. ZAC14D1_NAIMI4_6]AWH40467.1 peptidase S9 [Stenotrophomonas sp. ZAC14D1_NAIMI4_1]
MKPSFLLAGMLALCGAGQARSAELALDDYLRRAEFNDIQLSPTGEYLAMTLPLEDATAVAILRTSTMELVGNFRPPRNNHADSVDWVSDNRLLIGLAEKWGALDAPRPTGELYAMDANGKRGDLLVGYRARPDEPGLVSGRRVEPVAAFLADPLQGDDRNVLISLWPFANDTSARLERLDVVTGRRVLVSRSPVQRATFTTDNAGVLRFARGAGEDNVNKLYYRQDDGRWTLLNDEDSSYRIERPIGFSADNQLAYLVVQQASGPDVVVSWNPQTNERRTLLQDAAVDPTYIIHQPGTRVPVGVQFVGAAPRSAFFDEQSPTARIQRMLEKAFPGHVVSLLSATRDNARILVKVDSGHNPGDWFLFNTATREAAFLTARNRWFDRDGGASVRPVTLAARDGMPLHGFLTVPHGSDGRGLPMVVKPHGGPIGEFDDGSFERDNQLLAAAGYAVLQVNFRGSGNHGRAHTQAAAKQWGRAMQDDVTDATRWAIAEGIADARRICIYGASYGAYSALMGVAREPALYRCAAGYVGVYDLPLMFKRGDVQDRTSGVNYLRDWLGEPATLAEVSPVNLAARIKVPVLLAAGREDQRAPVQHTERMEAALKQAGVPVEAAYYAREGHGLYGEANRRDYYTRLLAFLARSLGGATAATAPAAAGKAKAP